MASPQLIEDSSVEERSAAPGILGGGSAAKAEGNMERWVLAHRSKCGSFKPVVKNADSAAPYQIVLELLRSPSKSNPGCEIVPVRRIELTHHVDNRAGVTNRAQIKLGEPPLLLRNRGVVFPPQAQVESEVRAYLPVCLSENSVIAGPQIALGRVGQAGLWVHIQAFKDGRAVKEIP